MVKPGGRELFLPKEVRFIPHLSRSDQGKPDEAWALQPTVL
jgi:hypothetical protein